MRIDTGLDYEGDLSEFLDGARRIDRAGYDGLFVSETKHDPFLALGFAAEHTSRVEVGTSIAVAFPRSPMHLAQTGYDLHQISAGRSVIGLGSQIKPHIEKRFSTTWDKPASRMRELILAVRAVWACWQDDEPLRFEGDFYRLTLMTPFFDPGPNPHGVPPVYLAAVGESMTRVAGEVADGLFAHTFTTDRYLREVTLPAMDEGFEKSGRARDDFAVCIGPFIVTGETEQAFLAARAATRKHLAFYASTPAYRPILALHGWADLQTELHELSRRGEWDRMGEVVPDEVLDEFALQGTPDEVARLAYKRYGGLADRISIHAHGAAGLPWPEIFRDAESVA